MGDTILDNTCGSGSFLVSALLEGRNFIGIDKDIDSNRFKDDNVSYVEISKQRIKSAFNNIDVNSEEYLNLKKINLLGDV